MRIRPAVVFLAVLSLAPLSGCVHVDNDHHETTKVVVKDHGPPPHAPAHGYRRKHQHDDVDLVFDSKLGVYVVIGTPDCWWQDGRYYRWREDSWSAGTKLSGPWASVSIDRVPDKLRGYKAKGHPGKGKSNGNGPGKGKKQ